MGQVHYDGLTEEEEEEEKNSGKKHYGILRQEMLQYGQCKQEYI